MHTAGGQNGIRRVAVSIGVIGTGRGIRAQYCGKGYVPRLAVLPNGGELPVYKVQGKVTYNGKPVVGANVTFTSETANKSAFGRTDDKGEYRLTTYGANDGAVEGKHIIVVSKQSVSASNKKEAPVTSTDYIPPGFAPEEPAAPPTDLIPAKYAAAETSGLLAVIASKGPNEILLELKD